MWYSGNKDKEYKKYSILLDPSLLKSTSYQHIYLGVKTKYNIEEVDNSEGKMTF